MNLLKVAGAALNQTPLDWEGNKARVLRAIEQARAEQVSLLCLTELCLSGYGCEDAFHSPGVVRTAQQVLLEVLPATRGMVVAVGLPVFYSGGLFDAACLMADGEILGFACKQNLAGEGIHYEPRWFKPWPASVVGEIEIGGQSYPLGDVVFDVGGVLIGFEICEDAWSGDRPGSRLARRGVDVLLNPSASHFAFGKQEIRRRFVQEGSRAFHVSYIYANQLGNESGRTIFDGGVVIASEGQVLANGPRFSFEDVHLTTAVVDLDATRRSRVRAASFMPQIEGGGRVRRPFSYPRLQPQASSAALAAWEAGPHRKEEEFARAVALGLFDYLRKSRSAGYVVSISGGADSAAVSILVALAVEFGVRELGLEGFCAKLPHLPNLRQANNVRQLVHPLLACVYQQTRNSGPVTLAAARGVAEAIGADFFLFDVEPIVEQYTKIVAGAIGRDLTWQRDDLALQNIQARVRSPGVWMLANLRGALLLATSNRSEAAVGYATMDGDTSGGLSPIAGIDKAFLRTWLRWMETTGPEGVGPLPALAAVNVQQPTAELRPPSAEQTDEGDLMPYEVLDAIERMAIRDKQLPLEVFLLLEPKFTQYPREQLAFWVERFFRLWCRNQWKRERYAPSFHVDDENLDPKLWCRFPILSGGFERELAELRSYLQPAKS